MLSTCFALHLWSSLSLLPFRCHSRAQKTLRESKPHLDQAYRCTRTSVAWIPTPLEDHTIFKDMVGQQSALLSAYSRSGLLDTAFSILEEMKSTPDCQPDVQTYSILIKSCLHIFAFDKVHYLLSDMVNQGIKPNTVTYNTLIDAYGKAKK